MKLINRTILLLLLQNLLTIGTFAQMDTLRVMGYNVLYYGQEPSCQGPVNNYHSYLKTIVQYTNPDILSLEKMGSIQLTPSDPNGVAPYGFADSIMLHVLNAAFPGRFAYCTYTNTAQADNMSVLFYNKQKLGFSGILCSYANITDFNTYKLYYKDADIATATDTTFLYLVLNHTQSGSGSSSADTRSQQITGEMQQLHSKFTHLPNVINMGDFNLHNSDEAAYQTLINPTDTSYRFYDPPYHPDNHLSYPSDWDNNASSYAPYLTTSTRYSGSVPNSCGTSGGGKGWYDHLLLSSWIINNTHNIHYISNSYRTIGNDGNRVGISINDAPTNTSAPANVITALFQMSNKYPVMVDLQVHKHTPTSISTVSTLHNEISISNPVNNDFSIHVPEDLLGTQIVLACYDLFGRLMLSNTLTISANSMYVPCALPAGMYYASIIANNGNMIHKCILVKL